MSSAICTDCRSPLNVPADDINDWWICHECKAKADAKPTIEKNADRITKLEATLTAVANTLVSYQSIRMEDVDFETGADMARDIAKAIGATDWES